MKIRSVEINNHRKEFVVHTYSGKHFSFPYAKAMPPPHSQNRIDNIYVDKELAKEGITYVLQSGEEGSIHIEQFLEYNEDPAYLAELMTYQLTLEARRRLEGSGLSRRQLAKRLNTSVPQLYRLIDPANTSKTINQLVNLLFVLGCNVEVSVSQRKSSFTNTMGEVLEDHAKSLSRLAK
jgi:DNA-binding TFAR19-related protein (PDSD5 family)